MNLARAIFFSLLMLGGIIGLALIVTLSLGLGPTNIFTILLLFIFVLFILVGWIYAVITFSHDKERRC